MKAPDLRPQAIAAPAPPPDPATPVDPAVPAGLFAAALQQAALAEPAERGDAAAPRLAPADAALVTTPTAAPLSLAAGPMPRPPGVAPPAAGSPLAGPSLAPAAVAVPPPAGTTAATTGPASPMNDAAPAAAWPPPGLSSLFPAMPLFAGHGAPVAVTAPALPGAVALPAAAPPALPAAPVSASAVPASGLAAATASTPVAAGARVAAGTAGARTGIAAAAPAAGPAPLAMALAAAGRGLVLPAGADRRGEGESGPAPTPASAAVLAAGLPPALSGSGLPRLDLHAAFPQAPLLHGARFSEDLGARLQWMAGRGGGEATLRIAPEGLGPVEIRLSLEGDRVDLGFLAAQAETRHALEQALPRLRELLAQQGLSLGQADVGDRPPPRGGEAGDRSFAGSAGHAAQGRGSAADESEAQAVLPPPRASDGLLDLYA